MRHLVFLLALLPACDCNAPCPPAGILVQAPADPDQITEVRVTDGAVCAAGPVSCGMSACASWLIPTTGAGTCTIQASYRSGVKYTTTVNVYSVNTCCGERLAAGIALPAR